jgi:hypothetical protein
MSDSYNGEEMEFVTKEQLILNGLQGLSVGTLYTIVDRIEKDVIHSDSFIELSFMLRHSNRQSIYLKMEGVPKYFVGTFSLPAIIAAAEKVANQQDEYIFLDKIDEPEHQEILIECFPSQECDAGQELIRAMEDIRMKFAKAMKDVLLEEAKNFKLIDTMNIFLEQNPRS